MIPLSHPLLSLDNYFSNSVLDWEMLSFEEKETIESRTEKISAKVHEVLFEEGSSPKGIYKVVSGKVKFFKRLPNGSEQLIGICIVNEVFGYRAILSNQKHTVSAQCIEPAIIEFIPADVFLGVLRTSNDFANFLLTKLSQDFGMWINRSILFTQADIRTRLALTLLVLNEKFKVPKAVTDTSRIHISRTDLAGFVGSSLEALVRMLKKFGQEGLVHVNGKNIVISDIDRLAEIANLN